MRTKIGPSLRSGTFLRLWAALFTLSAGCHGDKLYGDASSGDTNEPFIDTADSEENTDTSSDSLTVEWPCQAAPGSEISHVSQLGCWNDFGTLSSFPISADIPGARSVKVVIDRIDGNQLYFQNSKTYKIHYDFAAAHLSGNGLPMVSNLTQFNQSEYYSEDRRFILGAVTYYEEADVWTYEVAPYDTASSEMIAVAYDLIAKNTFFGNALYFHPTSDAVEKKVADLPESVLVKTTDDLYKKITFQPLNLGTSYGVLRFFDAKALEDGDVYVNFRDIALLDQVPNDISVVSGIITAQFQTPLSHINVLSQNRGTPNMALKTALGDTDIRALENKWVKLTVGAYGFELVAATKEEADNWWEEHRPDSVQVPTLDTSVTGLVNIEDILNPDDFLNPEIGLRDAIRKIIPAFGGKASHFAVFPHMDNELVPYPKAFVIPVSYYVAFMEQHDFYTRIDTLLADSAFQESPAVREALLETLRQDMMAARLDETFEAAVLAKLNREYPGIPMRFRSSTNAEDLYGFTGAGLYTSKTGNPNDASKPVADAIVEVCSSVWFFRAFEEREYRSISHKDVGMAVLVHRSFPDEEANGVAITSNIYDTSGLVPGFYVNVQEGENSVVQPEPGTTTDQFVLQYDLPGQPINYLAHSNRIPEGETVLRRDQVMELGAALDEIHRFFGAAYGNVGPGGFYAMDCEFKFDGEPGEPEALFIKQARPYAGWNSSSE